MKVGELWFVLVVAGLLAGCAQQAERQGAPATPAATPAETGEKPQARLPEVDVGQLLEKAGGLSYRFELVESRECESGERRTKVTKVWIRGDNTRVEYVSGGEDPSTEFPGAVHIITKGEYYVYNPQNNRAVNLTPLLALTGEAPSFSLPEDARVAGEEELGGRECVVLKKGEYTWWVWKEYGIPLRWVSRGEVIEEGRVVDRCTTTAEVRDLSIEEVPMSMFQLPPGAEVEVPGYREEPAPQPAGEVRIARLEDFFGDVAGRAMFGRRVAAERMPEYTQGGRRYVTLTLKEYTTQITTAGQAMQLIKAELEKRGIAAKGDSLRKEVVVYNVVAEGKRGTLYFTPLCTEKENCGMQLTFEYGGG